MGLKESHHVGRIVIHPKNSDIVYVAAGGHLYSENPEKGVYETKDGGKTWKKILEVKEGTRTIGVTDFAIDPLNPEIMYAASYDKVRKPWTFNAGGPGSGIYRSKDGGKTWKKLAGGLPTGVLGRIGIDVARSNSAMFPECHLKSVTNLWLMVNLRKDRKWVTKCTDQMIKAKHGKRSVPMEEVSAAARLIIISRLG
jgi:hypothetical protein